MPKIMQVKNISTYLKGRRFLTLNKKDEILKQYAKENHLNIYDIYVDDGISGTTFDRPDFNRMIQDIENNKVNMVIVKDTSRLGRDYISFGEYGTRKANSNKLQIKETSS